MTFGAHSVTGYAQCNSFEGTVRVTRLIERLSFDSVFSTLVLCLPKAETEKELAFFTALDSAAKYQVKAGQLFIYFDGSTKALIFR